MTGKLTARGVESLAKRKGRYRDDHGLFLRVLDPGHKVYWTYRFRLGGADREMSVGAYPEMSLDQARRKHAALRAQVLDKIDPLAGKRAKGKPGKTSLPPSGVPTFGAVAEAYLEKKDDELSSAKSRQQWSMTLRRYAKPLHDVPVNEVDTDMILGVLKPLWVRAPETASRLRGRIEKVLNMARALKHIDRNLANVAQWKGHLEELLPKRKKLANGHHAAMPYADIPEFMARLMEIDNGPARALRFTILTCTRSGEVLGAKWEEFDEAAKVWRIPASRMKTAEPHDVPLSDAAIDILRVQYETRGTNPHVFAGQRPMKSLTHAVMLSVLSRTRCGLHGSRI